MGRSPHGVRGVTSSDEAFVESYVGKYLADGGSVGIAGPWLLMATGLILFGILYAMPAKVPNPIGRRIAAGP